VGYLAFIGVLGYAVGFFVDRVVPKGIDDGTAGSTASAVAVDLGLLLLFAVQHTVMARPGFKRRVVRVVPAAAERTGFVLAASLVLALTFRAWRPLPTAIWTATGVTADVILAGYLLGWAFLVASTFLIDHADLFGLRQAYAFLTEQPYAPPPFTRRGLYHLFRHPMMSGFVVLLWAAPRMTIGHLLFAVAGTAYIMVGIRFEEQDLRRELGADYDTYRTEVPALVPGTARLRRRRGPASRGQTPAGD
jgi:methanethiol S-methyltransferase